MIKVDNSTTRVDAKRRLAKKLTMVDSLYRCTGAEPGNPARRTGRDILAQDMPAGGVQTIMVVPRQRG